VNLQKKTAGLRKKLKRLANDRDVSWSDGSLAVDLRAVTSRGTATFAVTIQGATKKDLVVFAVLFSGASGASLAAFFADHSHDILAEHVTSVKKAKKIGADAIRAWILGIYKAPAACPCGPIEVPVMQ
jgi:hypothetical protein